MLEGRRGNQGLYMGCMKSGVVVSEEYVLSFLIISPLGLQFIRYLACLISLLLQLDFPLLSKVAFFFPGYFSNVASMLHPSKAVLM